MSDIKRAFENKKAFIAFLTAGDPDLQSTARYIEVMAKAGADLIEIGIPFSDPIAEGEVIQAANMRALKNSVNLKRVLDMCRELKDRISVPLVFLTYLNPIFSYGYERFFSDCKSSNVSGVIIPDCPFEEQGEIKAAAQPFGVDVISLIAPTSDNRAEIIAKDAQGFIYLVSSMGVTGVRKNIDADVGAIAARLRKVTDTPVCVGFGISDTRQARDIAAVSDGVIVGSAIVKIIERCKSCADAELASYVSAMKAAVNGDNLS